MRHGASCAAVDANITFCLKRQQKVTFTGARVLWCEFTLFAISRRLASLASLTKFQAHQYSVRADSCWLPLPGCVLCALTLVAARLFTSHFRHLCTYGHRPSCNVRRVCSIVGPVLAVCFTTCFVPLKIGLGSGSGSSSHAGSTLRRLGGRVGAWRCAVAVRSVLLLSHPPSS